MFNHFILTRFNLRLWWHEDKAHQAIQTAEWLDERFRLFAAYTWPSVQAQTCRDFHWICLFDDATDEAHRSIITQYALEDSRFHPVFVRRSEAMHFQDIFRREILRWADTSRERLLTTYLDNDDALHCRFVKDVQQRASSLKYGTVISYAFGVQYYEQMNLAVRIPYKNNHFLSYCERMKEKNRTVWGFWHFSIFKYKNVRIELVDDSDQPMWVEVIHAGNIDNDVKMTLHHHLITRQTELHNYGIDILLPSKATCRRRFMTSFAARFLGQVVRRTKNKLKGKKI